MNKNVILDNIGIIILAAGGSTRLGTPKQLLQDGDGVSMIRRINTIAQTIGCKTVMTILGANHQLISKEIEDLGGQILINDKWKSGISSSIKLGIEKINQDEPGIEALLFLVCDQPFIGIKLMEQIIHQYATTGKPIVASCYQNIMGTPALFDRSLFPELLKLSGDRGAGVVIKDQIEKVALVDFKEGAFDIDTRQDYELFLSKV